MYPSTPHEAGLKALREALDKREQHTIPMSELIRMADFVLKNNYFEFNPLQPGVAFLRGPSQKKSDFFMIICHFCIQILCFFVLMRSKMYA